jgi:hypothetical protein
MTSRRSVLLLTAVVCAAALGIAACGGGGKSASRHKPFKTPNFLLHASLAFGAFHRFVLRPARSGAFSTSSSAVTEAADAAVFASNQLKLASQYAQRNPVERSLFAALVVLADKLKALSGVIRGPTSSLAQINAANESLGRVNAAAAAGGHHIPDATTAQIAAAGGPHA